MSSFKHSLEKEICKVVLTKTSGGLIIYAHYSLNAFPRSILAFTNHLIIDLLITKQSMILINKVFIERPFQTVAVIKT